MANETDERFMREALLIGETADREGNMGVGALIVRDGKILKTDLRALDAEREKQRA